MRTTIFFAPILFTKILIAQPYTKDDYVQNFYTTCKSEKYSAFSAIQTSSQKLDVYNYDGAIKFCNKAISIDSNYCDAYFILAYCFQRQGKFDQALIYCDKSITMNPDNPSAWTIKGTTHLMKNDTINAMKSFENAKKISPDKIDGYYGIALTYYRTNNIEKAISTLNEFEKVMSKDTMARDIKKMKNLKSNLTGKQ